MCFDSFRDSQREATIEKDRFKEIRRNLKEEIDRFTTFFRYTY